MLGALLILSGCRRTGTASQSSLVIVQEDVEDDGSYQIYYTNAAGDELKSVDYVPGAETFNDILTELVVQFSQSPAEDTVSVLSDKVTIQSFTRGVDSLTVDLDSGYLALEETRQVLLCAALVQTLVQMPGVVGIRITVDGQELANAAGEAFGLMDADDFISSDGDGVNSLRQIRLSVYFPGTDGRTLQTEEQTVQYSTNLTMERVVVERLLEGPVSEELLPVAAAGTSVNSIRVEDRLCIIDFNEHFSDAVAGVEPEIALYAFVNSICEACEIDRVQFMIDGTSDVRFRDQISLDQSFAPSESIEEES